MANDLQVYNYGKIDDTVQRMKKFVNELDIKVEDMTKSTQKLISSGAWMGEAADRYHDNAAKANQAIDDGGKAIRGLASTTAYGADNMMQSDKAGANAFG